MNKNDIVEVLMKVGYFDIRSVFEGSSGYMLSCKTLNYSFVLHIDLEDSAYSFFIILRVYDIKKDSKPIKVSFLNAKEKSLEAWVYSTVKTLRRLDMKIQAKRVRCNAV